MKPEYLKIKLLSFQLLLIFLLPAFVHGQNYQSIEGEELSPYIWAETMVNYSTIGPGYGIKTSVDFNRHQFHLRAIETNSREYNENTWEISFLYGRCKQIGNWHISGASGVAVIGGYRYSDLWGQNGAEPMDTMIGFPLEGQIYWSPVSFVGLGVYAYANVNTSQPIGGIGLSLKVGHIR